MTDPNARRKLSKIVITLEDVAHGKVLIRIDPDLPAWLPRIQREPRSASGAEAIAMLGLAAMRRGFNPRERDKGKIIMPGDGLTPI